MPALSWPPRGAGEYRRPPLPLSLPSGETSHAGEQLTPSALKLAHSAEVSFLMLRTGEFRINTFMLWLQVDSVAQESSLLKNLGNAFIFIQTRPEKTREVGLDSHGKR
jgi:hypothetical protein